MALAGLPPRAAAHALVLLLAVGVTATATITPAQRVVNSALGGFSIEDAAIGEAPFARLTSDDGQTPFFPPPDDRTLAEMRPRPSVVAHVVRTGDTVVKLADRYRVTASTIVWANNLSNPDRLPIGHALLILPMSGVLHEVRGGDTVEAIASKYQIEPQAIADANGLALGKQLLPADQLVIPGGRPLEPERPEVTTRSVDRGETEAARPAAGAPARTEHEPPKALKPLPYEVAVGDSIVSIARRHGVSPGTIVLANGIAGTAADTIQVGQKLTIPPVDGLLYKVGEGDAVKDLAARYGVDTLAIIRANALPEPYVLRPGMELLIPGGKIPDPPEPVATAAPAPPEPTAVPYTVAEGDTLVKIAERFGVEARSVARYNGLERSELISPGQSLMIPGGLLRVPSTGAAAPRSLAPPVAAASPPQSPIQTIVRAAIPRAAASAPSPPPAPAPKPVVPANGWGVVAQASKFLGYAYVWGGASPRVGFDCSGFTWFAFQQAGRSLPKHDLWGQMQAGPRVSQGNLQAGDLVFFANTYMPGLSHVGIYIGGGRFIHAGSERTGVTVSALSDPYWGPRYYGATRPW